jgi:DNA-binding NtrC family response regulator
VPELVEHFLAQLSARFGMRRKRISADAVTLLTRYDWRRNNVRELRNVVERMLIASESDVIEAEDVPSEIVDAGASRAARSTASPNADRAPTFVELKAEAERVIVLDALRRHEWHITRTAESLGLADHASLLKIMRRLGVEREG